MAWLKHRWLMVAVIAVVAIAVAAFALRRTDKTTYFTAKVERGDIREVVQATGTINALTTVQVGSQVSGTISELDADFNSRVKKGQIVAKIDPSLFRGALLQAQADLANSRANAVSARASYEKAVATETQAKAQYDRTQALFAAKVVPQQQVDTDRAAAEGATAEVAAAKAAIGQADAQVKQKEAAVEVAQTNLDHCIITSPIDGTVVSRSVDVGQTVAASLQAPVLFTIAQDLTKMQVYTQTDESDVGQIRLGQQATFNVDAFPKDTFTGQVSQVRMNATVVQNVVTYNTIIDFANPDQKLFPGMTAYVTLPVATANNALKVPDAALRYKPDMKPQDLRALLQANGIDMNAGGGNQQRAAGNQQKAGAPSTAAAPAVKSTSRTIIWKLGADGKTLEPVLIQVGITDHTFTEVAAVLKGELNAGDQLVTGTIAAKSASTQPGAGFGGPRR